MELPIMLALTAMNQLALKNSVLQKLKASDWHKLLCA
jgi:hypothetical protein